MKSRKKCYEDFLLRESLKWKIVQILCHCWNSRTMWEHYQKSFLRLKKNEWKYKWRWRAGAEHASVEDLLNMDITPSNETAIVSKISSLINRKILLMPQGKREIKLQFWMMILLRSNTSLSHSCPDPGRGGGGGRKKKYHVGGRRGGLHSPPLGKIE